MTGIKETENKIDYSEINWEWIDGIAKRMNANKSKYPKDNFKQKIDIKLLEQSLFRHIRKMLSEDINDPESYMDHIYAVGCNVMMIHEQIKHEQ